MRSCEFLSDDAHLVTCGGRDCAIIVWAFEARADAEGAGVIDTLKGEGQLYGSDPDVKTVHMTEDDRSRHPDLRDGSRYAAIASLPMVLILSSAVWCRPVCWSRLLYPQTAYILLLLFCQCRWDQDLKMDRTKNGSSEAIMSMENTG